MQPAPDRDGRQRFGVGAGEANALLREGIQIGRVDGRVAIATEVSVAEVITEDDDDVGFPGCVGKAGGAEQTEQEE